MGLFTAAVTLVTLTVLFTVIQSQEYIRIKRRMYAMCPPKFQRIGSECYAISDQPANWLEAHFQCKDKNSKLAEPNNKSDRKLRAFFQRMDHDTDEIWIGATFDWHINTWQWSISGKNLSYDAFSRLDPEQNLEYHCAVLNPSLKYRWSARSCVDKHRYICQHKMPKVSEKNRFKVYDRWNQTYPNQMANEVEMEVIDTKTKDGKRTNRRVKPIDSGENYPMPPRRSSQPIKQRRRPHVPPKETSSNDINVKFIPNYFTNDINGDVSYRNSLPATMFPLTMDFIPADMAIDNGNVQAAQAYMDTTTKRPRNPTNAPSSDNETVDQTRPRTTPQGGKRVKTKFDKLNEEKRRQERERKRAEHRRRKQMRLQAKQQEEERKKKEQEEELKKQEEERKKLEEERKKLEQVAIDQLKLKQAEEEKQFKEDEEAALAERQKLQSQLENSKKEQERQEAEEKILKEKREEEEERVRKERLHEQNRLQLEYEERLKEQQTERERKLEEEKKVAEENRRRAEQEEATRQEELKRLQEEDEKRLELQRMEIERKRQEKELARLEEENLKRIAAQKAREEEIRRREEALAAQLVEEKRLEEELRQQEEKDRLMHEQELQSDIEEKKRKEEAERLEIERKEELRRKKVEKLKEKLDSETKKLEEEKKEERKEKIRKYAERISRLSPEMQRKFIEARRNRKKNKNSDNEASIPERK
ncbi:trichohyalin isoform X2 [Episyrphus balteatus]|uniref:trichohyalin isoform X2 n=1 Tax=Episyrphus balteatus TaxID=286459 RepID=UPI002484FFD7|nr:trichohyalin isoform X2 [Episyrphus balteatus]